MQCVCANCKQSFERSGAAYRKSMKLSKSGRLFCSHKCVTTFTAKHVQLVERSCSECGSRLLRTKNQLRRSKTNRVFCSNTCKNKHCSRLRWGNEHSKPFSYRSRRKVLLDAAQSKCQRCGYDKDIRLLDIHHADGQHNNNNWSNLRVICVMCHAEHHRCNLALELPSLGVAQVVWLKQSVR